MSNFLPVIKPDVQMNTMHEVERAFKRACRAALEFDVVAKAIQPFKTNGIVHGHKTLDNAAAVTALEKAAPDHIRHIIESCEGVNLYRKTQLLDAVLRAEYEMDGKGKLNGNTSPAKLKRLAAKAEKAQPDTKSEIGV